MDLKDMNITITVEIVDGGFIVTLPVINKDGDDADFLIYRRSVVNSPRKAVKAVSEALNEFKLTIED